MLAYPAKGDYIVIESGKSNALCRVVRPGKSMNVVMMKDCHVPNLKQTQDIELGSVIANLGKSPRGGSVFGVDTHDLYIGTKPHDFADLHFFYKPEPETGQMILKAFSHAGRILDKHGLSRLHEDYVIWEIQAARKAVGSVVIAGTYKTGKGESPPRASIRPEVMEPASYPYVIFHELGHHAHFTYFDDNEMLMSRWVKLYNRSIKVTPVDKQECSRFMKDFIESGLTTGKYRGSLESDEDKAAFGKIVAFIKQNHRVEPRHIDLLVSTNNQQEVEALWPTQVSVGSLEPLVSEYGAKHVKELIAESFALYLTKKQLPGTVLKLLEHTLSYVKDQFNG